MSSNRMFPIYASPVLERCFRMTSEDTTHLWHCRYGHLSLKGLEFLAKNELVDGLPNITKSNTVCSDCLVGKQHRNPFPQQSTWRASKKLQLVHADICGPINPISNSGERYLITFIDDMTRRTWVYFLSEKSAALECFKKFKVIAENECGENIECLRTDRGGEFTSKEFEKFCSENGVKRQLTAAYNPQQNGVAERKNRTIMEMVRSILSMKKVPKEFWPEAVNWAVYVQNRSPTIAVKNSTPEEAWSGKKPSVKHFRIFGCLAYAHIPDSQRKKLDDKSSKCVLLGVSEESKAYRLFDPISKKIVISRDVVFDEQGMWNWSKKGKEDQSELADLEDNEENSDNEVITEAADTIHQATPTAESDSEDNVNQNRERNRRPPAYLNDHYRDHTSTDEENDEVQNFVGFTESVDPLTFEEASKHEKWKKAMEQELESIEKNKTWELINPPVGARIIGVKWLFKTKLNEKGEIDKHKARLVAKGYSQEYGIDYTDVFAPVARWDTIRTVLALAAHKGWSVFQLDVKSAFLHGELNEDIYVEQPQGYYKQGGKDKVYKLNKALYGLKQAPRAWYTRIENYFIKEGFEKCVSEYTLFVKLKEKGEILIVSLYVDDLIFTGNDEKMFEELKASMRNST